MFLFKFYFCLFKQLVISGDGDRSNLVKVRRAGRLVKTVCI